MQQHFADQVLFFTEVMLFKLRGYRLYKNLHITLSSQILHLIFKEFVWFFLRDCRGGIVSFHLESGKYNPD